jgi:ribonuclease T2
MYPLENKMSFKKALLCAVVLACGAAHAKGPRDVAGRFDYYTVAMSWSPSYCATNRDTFQCNKQRKLGFVLHGLWPQYVKGYPESCLTKDKLTPTIRKTYAAIYPSPKLVDHQWRKHGSCSGLDPVAYFTLSNQMRNAIMIPKVYNQPESPVRASPGELVQAFRAANPTMPRDAILPVCSNGGRILREVQACFDKSGAFRTCSEGQIKKSFNSCRQESFLLPNLR